MARSTVATDNFNRASLGSNWLQLNPTLAGSVLVDSSIQIKGQYGFVSAGSTAAARWAGSGAFSNDQFSSIKLVSINGAGNSHKMGAIARSGSGVDGSRAWYEVSVTGTPSSPYTTELVLQSGGTRTVLYSAPVAWVAGDTVEIEVEGTTIRACRNGTPLGGSWTLTNSALTAGKPGVVASDSLTLGDDWVGGDIIAADTTPPALTSPTGAGGALVCSGTVTTDEANGTLYSVATASSTGPTAAQCEAGQDHTGAAALRAVSQAVTATGTQTIASGAVTVGTRYLHFAHKDAAGNRSAVVSSASFAVTPAAATAITMTGPSGGQTGVASANFTVGANGVISGSHAVTLGDSSGGGTWAPATVTLTSGAPTAAATYTPGSAGAKTLTATDAGGYSAATPLSYTANATAGRILLTNAATDKLRDKVGFLLASMTGTFWVHHPTTGALVAAITQSTDAAGLVGTLTHAALGLSTAYRVDFEMAGGQIGSVKRVSEAT